MSARASALFSSPRYTKLGNELLYISRDDDDSPSFMGKYLRANFTRRDASRRGALPLDAKPDKHRLG